MSHHNGGLDSHATTNIYVEYVPFTLSSLNLLNLPQLNSFKFAKPEISMLRLNICEDVLKGRGLESVPGSSSAQGPLLYLPFAMNPIIPHLSDCQTCIVLFHTPVITVYCSVEIKHPLSSPPPSQTPPPFPWCPRKSAQTTAPSHHPEHSARPFHP